MPYMKVTVFLIQLLILITNVPMLLSTLKNSLTMLDSMLVVSCINRYMLEFSTLKISLTMLDSMLVASCINR